MTNILLLGMGGFTTFSAFGNETVNLIPENFMTNAFMNIGANEVLGLLAVCWDE